MCDLVLGKGYSYDNRRSIIDVSISDKVRSGHFWGFGTTRVGKTRTIENCISQDIRNGKNVVLIDPKGDNELLSRIIETAIEVGREKELLFFNPFYPDHSISYNPLKNYIMTEELVSHVVSGVDGGNQPFFEAVAYEASFNIIKSLQLLYPDKILTILDVFNEVSHKKISMLLNKVNAYFHTNKDNLTSLEIFETSQLIENLNKIVQSPVDYYNKISSSLRTVLSELCFGALGRLIGTRSDNTFIDRIETGEKVILIVQLGSLITRRASYTAGKVILSTLQSLAGRFFAQDRKIDPSLCVYVDEAQNVLYKGIEDLFAKAGGAGVYLMFFSQSIEQIVAATNATIAKAILDNCNTRMYMKVNANDTAEHVAHESNFGIKKVFDPIYGAGNRSTTFRIIERPNVTAEDATNMQPREFRLVTYSGKYYGKTLIVSKPVLKIRYPKNIDTNVFGTVEFVT